MGNSNRVEAIDALRGAAALSVVLYHYVGFIPLMGIPVGPIGSVIVAFTRYGYFGVPIFFMLSGYVIAMTASRCEFTLTTGARFVLRRLVRLVPPYWVMVVLIATTILAFRAAGYFNNTTVTFGQVVAHLTYTQNVLGFQPLDIIYWTLALEVQFYFVFAVSAVIVHRHSANFRSVWFAALTLGSVVIYNLNAASPDWFPLLWYQFGVGVLAYFIGREYLARLALFLILAIIAIIGAYRSQAADIVVPLVVGLLLYASRPSNGALACPRILLNLGRISYSLYLVHGFIGIGLGVVFRSAVVQTETAAWVAIGAGTAAAIASACMLYYLCERRAIEWSRLVRVAPATKAGPGTTSPKIVGVIEATG
jgi:peptidoglycan/LPS O-acetylase OafA/YrhL